VATATMQYSIMYSAFAKRCIKLVILHIELKMTVIIDNKDYYPTVVPLNKSRSLHVSLLIVGTCIL
jgi:hypothetical protein